MGIVVWVLCNVPIALIFIYFRHNDIPLEYDEKHYKQLSDGGIDEHLAKHMAHMFIRDPLQVK